MQTMHGTINVKKVEYYFNVANREIKEESARLSSWQYARHSLRYNAYYCDTRLSAEVMDSGNTHLSLRQLFCRSVITIIAYV
jgi:hypothetical protein